MWNINAKDFDWSNFLEFVKEGKRISYAASFGSDVQKMTDDEKNRMKEDLLKYDYLSVRESGSFDNVLNLTGKEPDINVDPTMLLTRDDWFRLVGKKRLIKSDYIFFYI